MPLPRPILDDRSYQQLRDELVRRIPVYNPEWTDHNASDPGVTLLELFAFLGENLLFRFNQIPEATRLAFLALLQIPLRQAEPARALLRLEGHTPEGTVVPAFSAASAGAQPFETTLEVRVFPVEVAGYARLCAPAPAQDSEADAARLAVNVAASEASFYSTAAIPADPSAPGAAPVDLQCSVDRALWVAVLATDETDAGALAGHTLNLGVALDEGTVGLDEAMRGDARCPSCGPSAALSPAAAILQVLQPCPGDGAADTSTDLLWQASTGELTPTGAPVYQPVTLDGDTTAGLRRSGVVRLRLPASRLGVWHHDAAPDTEGTGDFPPRLDDEKVAARLVCWLRAARRTASEGMPGVRWVGVNVTPVVQTRKALAAFVGTGTGQPAQTYRLLNQDVVPQSARLEVEAGPGTSAFEPWTEVADFDASTESDRCYVLDAFSGTVRFGDGLHGRVPQIGERIRVVSYRYGGGLAGNVPAKAISRLDAFPALDAGNPLPASGGADAEDVASALERVPAELRRHDRAVTQGDFSELALATPGAGVGRADVLARFFPPLRRSEVAGVVTVVVWPRSDARRPTAPMPDRSLLEQVCKQLDARRLVTTELWVIPPGYLQVAVSVGVRVKPGYGIEAVRGWVDQVLHQYLSPLPPLGPEGRGWPLGRTVDARELSAAALQVEGVQFLEGLELAWRPTPDAGWTRVTDPLAPTVPLERWQVVELAQVVVVEGPPPPAGEGLGPTPPARLPVPIPVIGEGCCR